MGAAESRWRDVVTATLVMVLLLAGALEVGSAALEAARGDRVAVAAAAALPTSLLGVSLAALVAAAGGRFARIAALFGSAAGLLLRCGLLVLILGGHADMVQLLAAASGLVLAVALVAGTLALVQQHGDLAVRAVDTPRFLGEDPQRPLTSVAPPTSPATPIDVELQRRTGRWSTVTTPWPRAVEDDPDGTLIRPPRR